MLSASKYTPLPTKDSLTFMLSATPTRYTDVLTLALESLLKCSIKTSATATMQIPYMYLKETWPRLRRRVTTLPKP